MPTQDERIKGLETITRGFGERLSKIEGRLVAESESSKNAKSSNWALPILLGTILAALLAYLGWVGAQIVGQNNKITTILAILQPQTALQKLSSVSTQPAQAKKELAQVASSIRQLSQARVKLPENTIDQTSQELTKISNTHKDLPQTWTAIGEFITYRSQIVRGWQETSLPLCDDQFHRAKMTAPTDKDTHTVTHGPVEIRDCKIVLDSPDATANLSMDLSMADIIFTHCAIFYSGGPIILVPVKMATEQPPHFVGNVYFRDCLFVVSLPTVPDERGMEFARALLTSPSGDIRMDLAS